MNDQSLPTDNAIDLAKNLVDLSADIKPFFEQAKGIKTKMEAEGWSPTAAEEAASVWLMGALQYFWTNAMESLRH